MENNLDFQEYKANPSSLILDIQMSKNNNSHKHLNYNLFWILQRYSEKEEFTLKIINYKNNLSTFKIITLLR